MLAALVGDGLLDLVSWASLVIPLLVIERFIIKPQSGKRSRMARVVVDGSAFTAKNH